MAHLSRAAVEMMWEVIATPLVLSKDAILGPSDSNFSGKHL